MTKPATLLVLLPAFLLVFNLHGQPLNRAYVYGNVGIPRARELGITLHGFRYFSLGYSNIVRTYKTGPTYHPGPGIISPGKRLKETYTFNSIYAGFTTAGFHAVNFSVMAGPSWVTFNGYENIHVKENENSHAEWVTYDNVQKRGRGVAIRSELVIRLHEYVGLQFAVEGTINPMHRDVNFMLGICVGMVEDPEIGQIKKGV